MWDQEALIVSALLIFYSADAPAPQAGSVFTR
jgi:hypothetical protein